MQGPPGKGTWSSRQCRSANCKGSLQFKSGRYGASLWPSEALYSKYLVSLEDGLEPPEYKRRGCPSDPPLSLHMSDTGHYFLGPFSPPSPFSDFSSMFEGAVFNKVLGSSKFCNKNQCSRKIHQIVCFAFSLHRTRIVHPPV